MTWALYTAFDVLGEPKGQPRPRAFVRNGHASVYDSATAEGWKGSVALAARSHLPIFPIDSPVRVAMTFFLPRPARLLRAKDPEGTIPHTANADADNLAKAILDALTQIGMWRDDSYVGSLIAVNTTPPEDRHRARSSRFSR